MPPYTRIIPFERIDKDSVTTTIRPGDDSTIVLDVEIDQRQLQSAIDEGVRHLGRRTRIPGFRPGKIPRPLLERALGVRRGDPAIPNPIYDEAREHLYERTVLAALRESDADVLQIPAAPEWQRFEEGVGAAYSVRVPVRPQVTLGDYAGFPFTPQVDEVTDEQIDQVIEQLRDQQATLVPVEDRGAEDGDFAVIGFAGERDGQPVEGAAAERLPLVIGKERMIPGFESNLLGMREGEERTFTVTFPDDYGEDELAGQPVTFTATLRELRERRLPPVDDDLAAAVGPFDGVSALRTDLRERMRRNGLDRARHVFADRIIEYATANATVTLPDLLVDREVDVMLDELKVRLAEQGIGYDDYLRVTEREESALRAEYRDGAAHRVKVLLVLGAVADREGVVVPDEAVEAEVARVRGQDSGGGGRLSSYLDSERGRAYVRSQLRRSQTVEMLIDRWIAAHPDFAAVQHVHGAPSADRIDEAMDDAEDEATEAEFEAEELAQEVSR
jgi:trigger factor